MVKKYLETVKRPSRKVYGDEDLHLSGGELRKRDISTFTQKDMMGFTLMLFMSTIFILQAIITRHHLPLILAIYLEMGIIVNFIKKYRGMCDERLDEK
jgi:uncharacterized ion transporter superfamily protein YfcC